ncbi:hypothetical protein CSKR_103189 [Clonorchis sinensis]|uniref:Uncharacterized protein n=1 Tax=Clonorchis sinensis TaxID=79923 RepID=A0A3R7GW16_CLOSI|nr:hypothetical protein CSKR_103189 [Clonorchis sinensis]
MLSKEVNCHCTSMCCDQLNHSSSPGWTFQSVQFDNREPCMPEFTDRKVRSSNPTSASRLLLSRLEQPGSKSALMLPHGGMAVLTLWPALAVYSPNQRLERERTDRKVRGSNPASASRLPLSRLGQPDKSQPSCFLRVAWQLGTERVLQLNDFQSAHQIVCLFGVVCL